MSLLKSMSGILIGLIFTINVASAADAGKEAKKQITAACGLIEEISKAGSMQGIQTPPWMGRLQSCCSSFKSGCAAVKSYLTAVLGAGGTVGCAVGTVSSAVGTTCFAVGETLGNIGTYCAGYGWQGYAGTNAGAQCTKMCYKAGRVSGQLTVNNIFDSADHAANAIFDGGSCAGITAEQAGGYINWLTDTIAKLRKSRKDTGAPPGGTCPLAQVPGKGLIPDPACVARKASPK
jgi:hypothetical protein